MNKIAIHRGAKAIVQGLRYEHHDAYVVGGCVRDSLLGLEPKDWDVCTSATPEEMKEYFSRIGVKTIDTGLKHGTITVDMGQYGKFEVTTFRIDGDYSDNRHPDSVEFTDSIYKDLSRRDFTINAMAFNQSGLVDPFHGREDLESGVIRCVGNPDDRFNEDALRILRAMRFSSTYGFTIDEATSQSIHKNKELLLNIAAERIQVELCKMLRGKGVLNVLLEYSDVVATIIPEMEPCIGFDQNNRFHEYTVYDHIAHAVANYTGADTVVNVSLLLHDIGKPCCYTVDEKGGHFYGHGVFSHDITEKVLTKLRFDNKTKSDILELVLYHDAVIEPTPKTVRRWLNKIGEKQFSRLLDIRMADILAHAKDTQEYRIERCVALGTISSEIIEQNQCFKLKDLAINGYDVMNILSLKEGKDVGAILQEVLGLVMNGDLENDKVRLVEYLTQKDRGMLDNGETE